MVEYTAIFPSQSAAMHERLKHLHHISCLCQSSLVTHSQSESKTSPKNYGGGPVTTWLVEPVRGLAECWTRADGAAQSSSSHVAKECQLTAFEAECLLWKASGVCNIYQQDRGFLKLHRFIKQYFCGLDGVSFSAWIFLWDVKQQQQHQNRMQTHSQTGYCANEYVNFSTGTNAGALGVTFKITFKSQSKTRLWPKS